MLKWGEISHQFVSESFIGKVIKEQVGARLTATPRRFWFEPEEFFLAKPKQTKPQTPQKKKKKQFYDGDWECKKLHLKTWRKGVGSINGE